MKNGNSPHVNPGAAPASAPMRTRRAAAHAQSHHQAHNPNAPNGTPSPTAAMRTAKHNTSTKSVRFKLAEGETLVVKGKYKLAQKLGNGSFGEIYRAVDVTSNNQVAVKIESTKSRTQLLKNEEKVFSALGNVSGVPKFYWYGMQGEFNFLVIELLGLNLEELFNCCNRKFSIKTVLMIADQMIALIEYFHSKNYIHRDIKPENFLTGLDQNSNKIYLIDYGLSKKYRECKQSHLSAFSHSYVHCPYVDGKSLAGTARYVSINAHKGVEQTRRDDLESCCYVLIYFCQGSLPWQGFRGSTKQAKYNQIHKCKEETSIEVLCKSLPAEFGMVLKYCRNLSFEQPPDYTYIRQLFRILLRTLDHNNDRKFDWVVNNILTTPSAPQNVKAAAKI